MTINDRFKFITNCKGVEGRKADREPLSLLFWLIAIAFPILCAILLGVAIFYILLVPHEAQGDTPTAIATTEQPITDGTLLEKIAYCESKNDYGAQNPDSTAYGRYQITEATFASANKALGGNLDILNPTDQDLAAQWLIDTRGTRPWKSTENCWNNH